MSTLVTDTQSLRPHMGLWNSSVTPRIKHMRSPLALTVILLRPSNSETSLVSLSTAVVTVRGRSVIGSCGALKQMQLEPCVNRLSVVSLGHESGILHAWPISFFVVKTQCSQHQRA